ncbi:hypothetical protein JKG68_25285 [Microvirga aerilata]|uniref:Uncharacterized protein n=1 Tax=Microvirga aerilata TaxID=670292 RepID=A0A936ZHE4_9HYPH|nr:hypothetical protein [Microvirga aerilata]MBL0407247.1 hypothetical protein [Microvirga aerilata]
MSKLPRIVSASVLGRPAELVRDNQYRAIWLKAMAQAMALRSKWGSVDALLLPGGYFRLEQSIGFLNAEERDHVLTTSFIGQVCNQVSRSLNRAFPGIALVVGIDCEPPSDQFRGDQLTVAWRAGKPTGIGLKVFPSEADTDGKKTAPMRCYAMDYDNPARIITLKSGNKALLCSCYDAFGVRAKAGGSTDILRAIRYLTDADGCPVDPPSHRQRRTFLRRWSTFIDASNVNVALTAIHNFEQPGRDLYWQRHGIASASAALGGGLVVGAAHYMEALPTDPGRSPLAACAVPRSHIRAGLARQAHMLRPVAAVSLTGTLGPSPKALLRLFEGNDSVEASHDATELLHETVVNRVFNGRGHPLPKSRGRIKAGDLVLAIDDDEIGWFEALVVDVTDRTYILRWRDYPEDAEFARRMEQVALMYDPIRY